MAFCNEQVNLEHSACGHAMICNNKQVQLYEYMQLHVDNTCMQYQSCMLSIISMQPPGRRSARACCANHNENCTNLIHFQQSLQLAVSVQMYIYGSVENVLGITLKTLGTWYDCGHEMPHARDTAPSSLYFIVFYHCIIILYRVGAFLIEACTTTLTEL